MGYAPQDGDDAVKQRVGGGGLGLGDVTPGRGQRQGGAHLGRTARGHAVQVKSIAAPGGVLLACPQIQHQPVGLTPRATGFAGQGVGGIARR